MALAATAPVRRRTSEKAASTEDIARVAYELYEQRGREDGHDFDDWLKAEQIVRQRDNGRYVLRSS